MRQIHLQTVAIPHSNVYLWSLYSFRYSQCLNIPENHRNYLHCPSKCLPESSHSHHTLKCKHKDIKYIATFVSLPTYLKVPNTPISSMMTNNMKNLVDMLVTLVEAVKSSVAFCTQIILSSAFLLVLYLHKLSIFS